MARIVLILTVLGFTVPALGTVTITAEQDQSNDKKIWIGYESVEAELIRSFALDITATDGNIIDVNDYAIGDDNGGYGIFPGSFGAAPIDVNVSTGEVDTWANSGYTPVAPGAHPDALGGIGTSGVTIELSALYTTAAPNQFSGILCSITVDDDVTEVCVSANAIRNNVLLESGAEVQNLVLPDGRDCLTIGPRDCFPNTAGYERQYVDWVAVGKPDCWCGTRTAVTSIPDEHLGYQCDGDANSDTQVIGWRVYSNDLMRVANSWQARIGQSHFDACADFDHGGSVIGWRVYSNDLVILAHNWQKKDSQLPGDCPRPD